jgi:hypothetical protein
MAIAMAKLTEKQLENLRRGREAARQAASRRARTKVDHSAVDFGAWLRSRLAQLEAQDAHLENTERGIGEQRRALAAQITEVRSALTLFGAWKPETVPQFEALNEPTDLNEATLKRLRGMTIAAGAAEIIRERGEATVREIGAILQRADKVHGKKPGDVYATVYSTLIRSGRFEKSNGRWKLKNKLLPDGLAVQRAEAEREMAELNLRDAANDA